VSSSLKTRAKLVRQRNKGKEAAQVAEPLLWFSEASPSLHRINVVKTFYSWWKEGPQKHVSANWKITGTLCYIVCPGQCEACWQTDHGMTGPLLLCASWAEAGLSRSTELRDQVLCQTPNCLVLPLAIFLHFLQETVCGIPLNLALMGPTFSFPRVDLLHWAVPSGRWPTQAS